MDIPPIDGQVRRRGAGAEERMEYGGVRWVVRQGEPPGAETTLGIATFNPGMGNVEHVHPNCEEIVLVLRGEVEHTLADQRTTLAAGDLIVVPRDAPHRLRCISDEPAEVCVIFSSPERQFVPTGR
jgi:quercetin dioxygenase-like cupin family protein